MLPRFHLEWNIINGASYYYHKARLILRRTPALLFGFLGRKSHGRIKNLNAKEREKTERHCERRRKRTRIVFAQVVLKHNRSLVL